MGTVEENQSVVYKVREILSKPYIFENGKRAYWTVKCLGDIRDTEKPINLIFDSEEEADKICVGYEYCKLCR